MKPIYLEFCGINSFSEKTQIDFRALLSGGVFGIFGDTGSGKSTILDCIHLALYGVIERASKSMNDCINYNADSAYVVFDFELTTGGMRKSYRVRRERKRKNGVTKAYLYEYVDGQLLALAEGTRDVDSAVEEIIGLTFNDFKMCIALPQGDFAALVKAGTTERVKLVSRLFDLEKYGAKLWETVSAKYYQAESEANLIKAEMGQNEGGRDEVIAEKAAEIAADKQALEQAKIALTVAEKSYEKAKALLDEKTAYDKIRKTLNELNERAPVMERKRKAAERLPLARSVAEKAKTAEDNRREGQTALRKEREAAELYARAQVALENAKEAEKQGGFDEKIVQISVALEKVRGAAADIKAAETAKQELDACIAKYNAVKNKYPQEDFAGEKAKIEKELAELGEDESLLDYIKHHCKDALLAETYGEVRSDLSALRKKYPETSADVEKLLKKYTLNGDTEVSFDVAKLNVAFKAAEQRRKALKTALDDLEKRKRLFDVNEAEKELLIKQGGILRRTYNAAQEKIALIKDMGTENALDSKLKAAKDEKARAQKAVDIAQEKMQAYHVEEKTQNALRVSCENRQTALDGALAEALQTSGFLSVEDALALIEKLGDEESVKAECKAFFDQYELCKHKYEEIDKAKFDGFDERIVAVEKENKRLAEERKDGLNRKIAAGENELERLEELRKKYRAFAKELAEKEKRKNTCEELLKLLRGNRFLEFIAAEYLQEISVSAGKTLLSLTSGRYFLRYDKEFKVGDNLDGGNLRAVKTLSGGETFLVSLALALSLSSTICQKSLRPIEFFFLDEGFGTLDEKLVDTVMNVLGKLSKNFAVGLISHVEELKHRIDNKILVTGATEKHGSTVRIERF